MAPVEDGSRDGAGARWGVEGDQGTEGPSGTAGGAAGQEFCPGRLWGQGLAGNRAEERGFEGRDARARGLEFDYEVNPEGLFADALCGRAGSSGRRGPSDERRTERVKTGEDGVSWRYRREKIRVAVKPEEDYLSVGDRG